MKLNLCNVICVLLSVLVFYSCNSIYKAGNLVSLHYPVETSLKTSVVRRYIDSLIVNYGYGVPDKWLYMDKLVNLDSVNNVRIYFKERPEEMYLISYQGQLVLADVYNEEIKRYDWVSERDSMPLNEANRILKRFNSEILSKVESLAKRDGLPDSIIYKSK